MPQVEPVKIVQAVQAPTAVLKEVMVPEVGRIKSLTSVLKPESVEEEKSQIPKFVAVDPEFTSELDESDAYIGFEPVVPESVESPEVAEFFQLQPETVEVIQAEPLDGEMIQAELPFLDIIERGISETRNETGEVTEIEAEPILDQLMAQFEVLEEVPHITEAKAIVAMLPTVLHEYLQETDPKKQEVLEQEFEVYCERLLTCLLDKEQIEPELVKQFALLLKKDYVIHLQKQDAPFMDFMHEQRSFINDMIQDIEEALHPILPWLARIAVRNYVVN